MVEILLDGDVVGRALANRHRPDLSGAGYGHGRYGFEFVLPAIPVRMIAVRRASDGAELAQSPRALAAAGAS
jgi:O-antigen biosynthesis protein